MKKIAQQTICLSLIILLLLCQACAKSYKQVDTLSYIYHEVQYKTLDSSTKKTMELSNLINQNSEKIERYSEISFTGIFDYTYGLYVEKIMFDLYCTHSCEIELVIYFLNMKDGEYSSVYSSNIIKKSIIISASANEFVTSTLFIKDEFLQGASYIIFDNNSEELFYNYQALSDTYTANSIKYSISNIKIYGEHSLEN